MAEIVELTLTDEQKTILKTFRRLFKNDLDEKRRSDSVYLLRWLIARDFDLRKSEQMLRNSISWRWEKNIDDLVNEEFVNYSQEYPYKFHGHGRDGHIVLLFPWGRWDSRKACENGEKDQLVRYTDSIFEKGCHLTATTPWVNRPGLFHSQVIVLCNMEGFTYRQLAHRKTIEALLDLVKHYDNYYPETLYRAVIFNAPWIFSILFSMMKQIMATKTISKVSLYTSNQRDEYESEIRELIDPREIPMSYGGTQTEVFQDLNLGQTVDQPLSA